MNCEVWRNKKKEENKNAEPGEAMEVEGSCNHVKDPGATCRDYI